MKKAQIQIQVLKKFDNFLAPKSSRAQIQIQEMAFVLIAVFILFSLVGMFALSLYYSGLKDSATNAREQNAIASVETIAAMPEISCNQPNCIDGEKLLVMQNRSIYNNYWEFASIKLIRSRAFNKKESEMIKCNTANYPDCDFFVLTDKKTINKTAPVSGFVAFCWQKVEWNIPYDRPGKCEIARVEIGVEKK
ncbi:MAG: hypothetical protein ACP5OG_03470 [Candidatus Nanoarchaeia archaeon]